ncbi:MAG TPA: bifunctional glutamate N-acetyltransferase/amino-acid acetyltransferase ArgJ [Phycisphaerales bacterium]|nr:bifunctional glutamate N-acetyltransferase/amino-acid acetyltransferase ArgJ [Phycisphaerales bacterium]
MSITRPLGFRAAATTAGIKPSGKPDLALIVCDDAPALPRAAGAGVAAGAARPHPIDPRRTGAAVFTRNAVVGAPVEIGREWRARAVRGAAALRAILINAGCANAATGQPGIDDARATMRSVAELIKCSPDEVMPSSTGVIGHRLPVDKITRALPALVQKLARGEEADEGAAAAIMTTDLVPKMAHRELEIGGRQVHLGAIGKGSGMIAPRLDSAGPQATMLAFITTDAAVHPTALQHALEDACRESFDRISVDAHPSCSDSVFVMASGASAMNVIHDKDPEYFAFRAALTAICQSLATKVVRDGEGVTRTFRVEVKGAADAASAEKMARAVVDSPLVKCAIHGKDPNWGRIVTAAGNAGIRFDTREASLTIGDVEVYRAGVPTGVGKTDPRLVAAMNADPVLCTLTVGHGQGRSWMLGCDLSAEYVRINAEYTT